MREIKFRAWNGGMMRFLDEGEFILTQRGIIAPNEMHEWWKAREWPLMQYTGLKDKNGKEIYEGDILKDDTDCWLEVKFGKLPFDKSGDCVCTFPSFYAKSYGKLGQAPCHECEHIGDWMKIIGNIYENPDWREL